MRGSGSRQANRITTAATIATVRPTNPVSLRRTLREKGESALCRRGGTARLFPGSTRSSPVQLTSQPTAKVGPGRAKMATEPGETQHREQAPTFTCG